MKQIEMKKLIASDLIDTIVLHLGDDGSWFVMANGFEDRQVIVEQYGNLLMTERGQKKTYTSLDRAYKALCALGWDAPLTIMP